MGGWGALEGVVAGVVILCSTPPHFSPLRPIPTKVRFFFNSWVSLGPVSLSELEEGGENAFLNCGSFIRFCTQDCRVGWMRL